MFEIGLANDPRLAVRGTESMRRRESIETENAFAASGQMVRGRAAHGTETDDPVDLLRLAAYRSDHPDRGQPAMVPMSVALSDGEEARLALIASNRSRRAGPLIREALDLLFARHG